MDSKRGVKRSHDESERGGMLHIPTSGIPRSPVPGGRPVLQPGTPGSSHNKALPRTPKGMIKSAASKNNKAANPMSPKGMVHSKGRVDKVDKDAVGASPRVILRMGPPPMASQGFGVDGLSSEQAALADAAVAYKLTINTVSWTASWEKTRRRKKPRASEKPSKKKRKKHKKKYRSDSDEDGSSDGEDSDTSDLPPTQTEKYKGQEHAFFNQVEAYFTDITQDDLSDLLPQGEKTGDRAFQIPPLGRFYGEVWAEMDAIEMGMSPPKKKRETKKKSDDAPPAGDLAPTSQRLLSALIPPPLASGKPRMHAHLWTADTNVYISKDGKVTLAHDASPQAAMALDERVKLELASIGLIDPVDMETSRQREDDDVCVELRKLQKQLNDQIRINNEMKARLYSVACAQLTRQERKRELLAADYAIEKFYQHYFFDKKGKLTTSTGKVLQHKKRRNKLKRLLQQRKDVRMAWKDRFALGSTDAPRGGRFAGTIAPNAMQRSSVPGKRVQQRYVGAVGGTMQQGMPPNTISPQDLTAGSAMAMSPAQPGMNGQGAKGNPVVNITQASSSMVVVAPAAHRKG